jgi:acetyltransferase-like isoleucine patch superfamily enzyme
MMSERALMEVLADNNESAAQRYQRMFVGQTSIAALLRYELLTGLLGPLPGALGYLLRSRCYPWLLHHMGRGTVIGRGVVLRCPGQISIGDHVMLDDYVVLDAKGDHSQVTIGNQVLIGRSSILSCNQASIRIGNVVSIGPFVHFACKSLVEVGSHVQIGSGVQIMAGSHASDDPDILITQQERLSEGIVMGDNVWIGASATILDGVTIGTGSIVGAGSVVNKDVPPDSLVLGNPARVVKNRRKTATL